MECSRNSEDSVLVLWDIDHTLIETRGVGGEAFSAAFEQVTGHPVEQMPHVTGRTEPDIYAATAELHGIRQPPPFRRFADALESAYVARRDELRQRGRGMPGAAGALAELGSVRGLYQSVLTGNTRTVSHIKLETFGLRSYLDLEAGAYGDDDGYRPALVPIAQARAGDRYSSEFAWKNTILIGDSPGDVQTAVAGGARIIAVVAGGTPVEHLVGADHVLPDLTDTERLKQVIGELARSEI